MLMSLAKCLPETSCANVSDYPKMVFSPYNAIFIIYVNILRLLFTLGEWIQKEELASSSEIMAAANP
jgi:hypothetical protein